MTFAVRIDTAARVVIPESYIADQRLQYGLRARRSI